MEAEAAVDTVQPAQSVQTMQQSVASVPRLDDGMRNPGETYECVTNWFVCWDDIVSYDDGLVYPLWFWCALVTVTFLVASTELLRLRAGLQCHVVVITSIIDYFFVFVHRSQLEAVFREHGRRPFSGGPKKPSTSPVKRSPAAK